MDTKEIRSQLESIEGNNIFELDIAEDKATIEVCEHDFDVNGLTYFIDGEITRNIKYYRAATRENPEEFDLGKGEFNGELTIIDQDGEELFYDEINLNI